MTTFEDTQLQTQLEHAIELYRADVDSDGVVGGLDVAMLTSSGMFGQPATGKGDMDQDGVITGLDVAAVTSSALWGQRAPVCVGHDSFTWLPGDLVLQNGMTGTPWMNVVAKEEMLESFDMREHAYDAFAILERTGGDGNSAVVSAVNPLLNVPRWRWTEDDRIKSQTMMVSPHQLAPNIPSWSLERTRIGPMTFSRRDTVQYSHLNVSLFCRLVRLPDAPALTEPITANVAWWLFKA